jgi:hypothetical protein
MTKAETVTVVVYPSGADADTLTVFDAMQQVLDTFALLSKVEAQKTGSKQIVWRLERASTNSPLTVSAIAVPLDPAGVIDQEVQLAISAFEEGFYGVLSARDKATWIDREADDLIRRILKRNLNGVGRTDVRFGEETSPIVIDHRAALRGVGFLEMKAAEDAARDDLTRTEYGAVEGYVIGVTTHYNKPAFSLRTRLSEREVKCVLRPEIAAKIGGSHDWNEAWAEQRVLVRGGLYYNARGDLVKVYAEDIEEIRPESFSIADIRDEQYDPGASPVDFLDDAWGEPNA